MYGFAHYYHLGESTHFEGHDHIRSDFDFLFHFSTKFLSANRIAPDGKPRRHIWNYSVCLCPIKRTPGLNELINYDSFQKLPLLNLHS